MARLLVAPAHTAAHATIAISLKVATAAWAAASAVTSALSISATTAATARTATIAASVAASTTSTAAAIAATAIAHALQHFCASSFGGCHHHIAAWWLAGATPDGLTAHGNRFGALSWLRSESVDQNHFNILFGETLNVLHEAFFIQANQAYRRTVCSGAPGPANAVNVVFADVGYVVIDDVG